MEHSFIAAYPCWWQLEHVNYGEDARVLLNGVTYTISVPWTYIGIIEKKARIH